MRKTWRIPVTIRGYCGALILLAAVITTAARLAVQPHVVPENAVAVRFTGEQMTERAAVLSSCFLPGGPARQWSVTPYGASGHPRVPHALWRVDGDEMAGHSGVHFLFDAQSGEMLLFSYSAGGDPPLQPTAQWLSRQETLRSARHWLQVYEQVCVPEKNASAEEWKAEVSQERNARSVLFRSGRRTIQVTLHPSRGMLLRLSAWSRTPPEN